MARVVSAVGVFLLLLLLLLFCLFGVFFFGGGDASAVWGFVVFVVVVCFVFVFVWRLGLFLCFLSVACSFVCLFFYITGEMV